MKGVIFNVFQDVVETQLGEFVWDDVLDRAGLDGAYTALGNYPDGELAAIAEVLAEQIGVRPEDVLVMGGQHGFRFLAGRHLDLIDDTWQWREFLHHLDVIVHSEVRKIHPDAEVATFDVSEVGGPGTSAVVIDYRSERHLCPFAEGLLVGLGEWMGVSLDVQHVRCTRRGDVMCRLSVQERP